MSSIGTVLEWAEFETISACEIQNQPHRNPRQPGSRRRPE